MGSSESRAREDAFAQKEATEKWEEEKEEDPRERDRRHTAKRRAEWEAGIKKQRKRPKRTCISSGLPESFQRSMSDEPKRGFAWLSGVQQLLIRLGLGDAIGSIISYATRFEATIGNQVHVKLGSCHVRDRGDSFDISLDSGPDVAEPWLLREGADLVVSLYVGLPHPDRGYIHWSDKWHLEDGVKTKIVEKRLADNRFAMHEQDDSICVLFPMNQTEPGDSGAPHPFDPRTHMEMEVEANPNTDQKTLDASASVVDAAELPLYVWRPVGGEKSVKVPTSCIEIKPKPTATGPSPLHVISRCTIKLLMPK